MASLPRSARLACWLNGWLAGRVPADRALAELAEPGRASEFVGPDPGVRSHPVEFLALLRRWDARRLSVALPVPGDPLGLGGPPDFNAVAIDAREAVLVHGPDIGLVPSHTTTVTSWHLHAAHPSTYLPSVAEAGRALRLALVQAADGLAALDVAAWRPEVADALTDLREVRGGSDPDLPFPDPEAARLAAQALRAWAIVELATTDDGGAASASEASRRAEALRPLGRAARSALVASTSGPER